MTMRFARPALIGAFGLFSLGGLAAAQTAAPKMLVDVNGLKLNVRLSGTAKPGAPNFWALGVVYRHQWLLAPLICSPERWIY